MPKLSEPSDAIDKGPNCKLCIDRKVAYARDDLLNWLYHMLRPEHRPLQNRTIRLVAGGMISC